MEGSVLIIDAQEDFAEQIATTLRSAGIESSITGDGKAGLDLAHINIPSAIILCVELPRMSGYSICAKLKKDATLKSVPLIITSAEATQETFDHHKKLKTRAEEYIKKPFEPPILVEVLERYLGAAETPEVVEDEIPISEDLVVEAEPPLTIDDAEAFSEEEAISMKTGGEIDSALEALEHVELSQGAGLGEGFEEDEVMTSVGAIPTPLPAELDSLNSEIALLKAQLEEEQGVRVQAERDRDEAVANEKAAAAQAQAVASQTPAPSSGGREVLELKKEINSLKKGINAKERELLELREQIQSKDDREIELEGQIVQKEEDQSAAEQGRVEAEGKLAAAEAKHAELHRSSEQNIEDLNRRLGEATTHEAELDDALQNTNREKADLEDKLVQARAEIDGLKGDLENREAEMARANAENLAEQTRLTNELTAAYAESESLREQIAALQTQVGDLTQRIAGLEGELDTARSEIDQLRAQSADAEERSARAYQKIREDEETKNKAKKALGIALALLQEAGYGDDGISSEPLDEAMP